MKFKLVENLIDELDLISDSLIDELKKLDKEAIHISEHDDVINYLKENVTSGDVIITLGAGNVTKIANKIKEMN